MLQNNDEFTSTLGRISLASGKLESQLMNCFRQRNIYRNFEGKSLGRLIEIGKTSDVLDNNLYEVLLILKNQRNYLTHNIYGLLNGNLDETILEGRELTEIDQELYIDRAHTLLENIIDLIEVVRNID